MLLSVKPTIVQGLLVNALKARYPIYMQQSVKRLIGFFNPNNYNLSIAQDSEKLTFGGNVQISGNFQKMPLTLHSSELVIKSTKVNGQSYDFAVYEDSQELIISAPKSMLGDIDIEIEFSGVITKPMHGLYPCFFEHEGVSKRLLATQFESHHAREVFPCVDEPEAKATFKLSLTGDSQDVCVSNMPIESENISGKSKTTTFETSPLMSTYLLAWVTGELVYEESMTEHGVTVRAYSTATQAGKTNYGLEVACKALDYMDDYFGIPYPLKKCDILALPDFAAGAMENWGCITFRESAMLVDPEHSDLGDKQHVAEVITHELAHQWFGNLVTMRWWEDLWLNEGFASWIPYLVLNDLFPEWKMWEQFSTGDLVIGMRADSLENTHPIVVEINNPNEIRSAFDSISYDKGCSVINLLFRYIGPDAFQMGLREYLKHHAYGNAETSDLWDAWAKSSGKDVGTFMKTWTTKKGFPIIEASVDSSGKVNLKQDRFFINRIAHDDATIWPVPLIRNQTDTEIFKTKVTTIDTLGKLNCGQSGFYRVIYDETIRKTIEAQITAKTLSPIDAMGLINDASEASKAGYHSTIDAIKLISSVNTYESEALIGTALGELASIRSVLSDTFDPMKPYVANFIEHNLSRLGVDKKTEDNIDDELLRPMIIGAASYSGNFDVINWALELFESAKTPENIRPDMRSIVYHAAVRENNNQSTYNKLLNWYNNNTIPGEQVALTNALTSFKDPIYIEKSLAYITTDNVKLQDSLYWIAYSLIGRHSKNQAWDWLQNNWDWVGKNFGKEKEIDYYLRYAANGFATKEHLDQYTKFFNSVDIHGSIRAFEQGKETIQWQTAWKDRDHEKVVTWLNSY